MRFNHIKSLYLSGLLFLILFFVGFLLAQHKLLWIDECFTQHVSIDRPSYADILTLHFPDGNKCPLFYILQKINCDLFSFHYPVTPPVVSQDVSDVRSQIIIRIPSDIYMSLALAGIFYYFLRFFSLFAAIYALAVALVSPMVWMYWVEARPYSLWFLLTCAQLLIYCYIRRDVSHKHPIINRFVYLIHVLLILTTPGSIFQIFIVSMMLLWKGKYKKRQLIWAFLLPMSIFLVYYFLVPAYKFKSFSFLAFLYEAVMPERMFVYVLYALAAWVYSDVRKKSSSNTFFFPIFLLFLLSGLFILSINLFNDKYQFGFHYRYLIYLVPADILMYSLASLDLWQWSKKNFWVCMNFSIILIGLVIIRGLMTYREILASGLYLHSPGRL